MSHQFGSWLACSVLLLALVPCQAEELVVKIGLPGPLSGGLAHLGKENENSARLALDELNAKGVTIGGRKAKFELLVLDDAGDPRQGAAIAQKLVDSKVNGVIGHLNSGTTIPASKIYSDAGIPQISPSATNPRYTRQGYKTTFRVVADDTQTGSALARFAVRELKGKRFAIIDDRTAYGQGIADEFEKGVRAAGGTIVDRGATSDKATDFVGMLSTLKSKNPDVVFFGGMDAVAGPMLQQMKQLGFNAKFLGGDGICSNELPKLAAGAITNGQVVCAEPGLGSSANSSRLEKFKADYKKKFSADVNFYAPNVYDAVNVMVAAMVAARSAEPAKYLPELAKTSNYQGLTGRISFAPNGDLSGGAVSFFTYNDGRRQAAGTEGGCPDCGGNEVCCKNRSPNICLRSCS